MVSFEHDKGAVQLIPSSVSSTHFLQTDWVGRDFGRMVVSSAVADDRIEGLFIIVALLSPMLICSPNDGDDANNIAMNGQKRYLR